MRPPARLYLTFSLFFCIFFCLWGCGGSNNSAPAPTPTSTPAQNESAGIWIGTLKSVVYGTQAISGVIGNNGQAFFSAARGLIYSGQVSLSGTDVSGALMAYAPAEVEFPNGGFIVETSASGTVKPQVSLSGSYQGGGDSGTFNLTYASNSANPTPLLSLLNGAWSGTPQASGPGSGVGVGLSISASGQIGGTDLSTGCQFSGGASVINPSLNAYAVTLTISSCMDAALDQNYTGLAYLSTTENPNDTLTVGVGNTSSAYVFVFTI
jgi:hypothetical protein